MPKQQKIVEEEIKTGIKGFDKVIKGGIPSASTIILIGPPGTGKSTFSKHLVYEKIKEGKKVLYVTLDSSPKDILEDMKHFGFNIEKHKDNIRFIDAYSWRFGKSENIVELNDINKLNITISEALKDIDNIELMVFDSLSTLLLYSDPELVKRFIPVLIAKGKNRSISQLFVLEKGIHDENTITTMEFVSDGVIEFKMEDKRYIRITKMKRKEHSLDWIPFKITDRGIEV